MKFLETLKNIAQHEVYGSLVDIWNFPLFTLDKEKVTIGTLSLGLFFLVSGFLISKLLSRRLVNKVVKRTNFDLGVRASLQSLSFYFLFIFFTLFALKMAHIPLTIFTVLGGALAIGVGLGSQNIVNNFISGLIIMFERPIKVGDFIELTEVLGHVEHVGMRSTHIKTLGNRHIIIPNSYFLENQVLNWTFSDQEVRGGVKIGVAYGSDVERVKYELVASVKECPKVIEGRDVRVFFENFGDNALEFEVQFWIQLKHLLDRKEIESEVRCIIDRRFREEKITIAFPQRDLHLLPSSQHPFQVQLTRNLQEAEPSNPEGL